jgi:hypothetical protein
MAFPVEEIPAEGILLLRVHKRMFVWSQHRPSSACFDFEELSTNWQKYSGIEATRNPDSAAVVSLIAQECRNLQQQVIHAPINEGEPDGPNQAHTHVCGTKPKIIRDQLARMAQVVWCSAPP